MVALAFNPIPRRQRQADLYELKDGLVHIEFQVSQGYMVSLCSKRIKKQSQAEIVTAKIQFHFCGMGVGPKISSVT